MIEHIGTYSRRRFPLYPVFFLFAILAIAVFIIFTRTNKTNVISPLPNRTGKTNVITRFFTRKKDPEELRKTVKELASQEWKNYSVYVKDMNSDFQMGLGEKVIFTAASVNKIPILASLYFQFQKGDVDMDKIIALQEADIQDYGTGSIRYDPVGTPYSIKTLARLMIEKSDNTAAHILSMYVVGPDTIQDLISGWGLIQTDMEKNKTSNYDMAILMEKIFHEKIANRANTLEMLSFMEKTDFEDRLPALLPKETVVYHKIGTEIGVIHDVGIVVSGEKAYYIGIMTSDITDENKTVERMAKISKAVFDYMK